MEKYMSTREVAAYLGLNEKKIYAMAAKNEIPAARVSGKWLFPREAIDRWIERNTRLPDEQFAEALLERMVVMQGSDDPVLDRAVERFRGLNEASVVSARIGSLAGLKSLAEGNAHLAGCHVENQAVRRDGPKGCYLVSLFSRSQGLMFDQERFKPSGPADLPGRLFAARQPQSGTWRLGERLLADAGVSMEQLLIEGTYTSHLDVALAVRSGRAEVGLGSRFAAERCGLGFLELIGETYKLALPLALASNTRMARFLTVVLDAVDRQAALPLPGYDFGVRGRLETINAA